MSTPAALAAAFTAIDSASSPAFSIDGSALFHLRGGSLPQIWRIGVDGSSPVQLTAHDEKVAFLRRAPKDDRVVYGIDAGGDERQQFWLLEDGVVRALTQAPGVIHDFGAWSPDGSHIAYTANDRDPAHFDVLVMDTATGAARRLLHGTNMMSVAGWSPSGDRLLAIADHGFSEQTLWIVPLADGALAHQVPTPERTRWASVRWAKDGDSLVGLTDLGGHDLMRLGRIDPDTGTVFWLYTAPEREVEAWSLSPGGDSLATIENDAGAAVLRVGELAGERPALTELPGGGCGMAADLAWAPDGGRLAFSASSPTDPSGLYLWEAATGAVRVVWRPEAVSTAVGFTRVGWDSLGGLRIQGWMALPPGEVPAAGHPAVIWVHGGPASQARAGFRPDMQMLLALGFAVLMPNVRGSTGYGRAFTESDDVGLRLDSVADLAQARHFLAARPEIAAGRIAVMGQSYGGYMVLAAITEYPDLWHAAIDFYGIADFATLLAATGPWRRRHRAAEYGDPATDAALFERISPLRQVERIQAPLLVLHGIRDPRVPIEESQQLVTAMLRLGKNVAFETFDYAGHGFIRPADRLRAYTAVGEFLQKQAPAL